MTEHKTIFDDWRSISIALYMTLVGYSILVGIPVISSAWVNLLGFTEEQVGRVAGADLGGLAVGAVMTARVVARINRRYLVAGAVVLVVAANALCMSITEYQPVLFLRFLSGVGSGIYTAIAVVTLGASSKPARAYNMMLFAFAFSQALELYFLPKLSMNGIYMTFIAFYLIGLVFLRWVPAQPLNNEQVAKRKATMALETNIAVPKYIPWLVLAAIFTTYINIGAYWTYIELATVDSAATPEWVNRILVWTSFCSILGCLFATVISNRYGLARPLLVALICHAAIVYMLVNGITNTTLLISVFSFNFLWIFIDVYQMSTIANVDHSGKFSALIPGAQSFGQMVGPVAASFVLGAGLGYSGVFIMCAIASLTAMSIYLFMYMRVRVIIPALADAT